MKHGWKTTEFWVTALSVVGLVASSVAASLSAKYAAIGVGVSVAAYSISRGLAKLFSQQTTPEATVINNTSSSSPEA